MKIFKRIIAVAMVLCTMVSLTACSDTTWVYDYSGTKVKSGVYILEMMSAYISAENHKDINPDIKDIFKQKLDGKPAKQWIIDTTKKNVDAFMAIEKKFDELELTLSETDNNIINQSTESTWKNMGAVYEENAVSMETYRTVMANQQKQQLIFSKYYDKGGIEEVSNDNLLQHFKTNFASINMFIAELKTGDTLTDEDKATNEKAKEAVDLAVKMMNEDKKTYNEAYDAYAHKMSDTEHKEDTADDTILEDKDTMRYLKKGTSYPSEKAVTAIFDDVKIDGDAVLIPEADKYIVVKRYDASKDTANFDEMRKDILVDVKGEDFNKLIEKWTEEMGATSTPNNAAVKRYKPSNIKFS